MTQTPKRIAHLSDIHIRDFTGVKPWHFLNKRVTGGANLVLGRSSKHQNSVVQKALSQLAEQDVDHLIVTGDLSNLALDSEFAEARKILEAFTSDPSRISVIPGNHDYYTKGAVKKGTFEAHFSDWMRSDIAQTTQTYPYLKILGDVAVLGINTCFAAPPLFAVGRVQKEQLNEIERLLSLPEVQHKFVVAAMHHHLEPPLHTSKRKETFRQLRNHKEVLQTLLQGRVNLVIHGHNHQHSVRRHLWPDQSGTLLICEAGSSSVAQYSEDHFGGKYNLYDLTTDDQGKTQLQTISTWIYRPNHHAFEHWKDEKA